MIKSYTFGSITIEGKGYSSDVIIYPDRVNSSWWRKEGHSLCVDDIKDVVEGRPEVLVVGTGNSGLMDVPKETRDWIQSKGIELIAEPTERACKTYNKLCEENKKVVAALHLTC